MKCSNCGHEVMEGASFCPHCGERLVEVNTADDRPLYQTEVKGLRKAGKLTVYRDRTEFATSSVQKTIYNYTNLVAVRMRLGLSLDHIDFITEDGQTESCDVNRKTIHEAYMYIEQAASPYIAKRKERLLAQGIHYSIMCTAGLTEGILNISDSQAEFRAKTGQSEIVFFQDVKSVRVYSGIKTEMLEFSLTNRIAKTYGIDRDLRDEVFSFVQQAVEPYIAERKRALRAQGIYFSGFSSHGAASGTLNILEDRAEFISGAEPSAIVFFRDVRAVRLLSDTLELALTDGTSRSFTVEKDIQEEVLLFVQNAIQPYVLKRTVGFQTVFGIDEKIEINEDRGVFHILRQGGNEITEEVPLSALIKCERTECSDSSGVLDKGIDIFSHAAKVVGAQNTPDPDDKISYVGVLLTYRTEQGERTEAVRFGDFFVRMSRTSEKYGSYLEEVSRFLDYLGNARPECELIVPALPDKSQMSAPEKNAQTAVGRDARLALPDANSRDEISLEAEASLENDSAGIRKYIEGVSRFISTCTTPMTIAIQGSGGIAKKTTMKMLYASLKEHCPNNRIWFDARTLLTPNSEGTIQELVGKRLVNLLSGADNNAEGGASKERTVKITKSIIGLVTGIVASDTQVGRDLADELLFKGNSELSPEKLGDAFSQLVRERAGGTGGRVIFLISDLDKLAPAKAVELMKTLRQFYDCDECVYVTVIDHDFFLRGAMENPDVNEQRAKALFDEVFQMFFRIPVSGHNVRNNVKSRLERMDIYIEEEEELDFYAELIRQSVGVEAKNMDRLFNSFFLIKNMADSAMFENNIQRLMLFALLCMQERFSAVYNQLKRMKDNVTPALLTGLCSTDSEVVSGCELSEAEAERFRAFAQVFCDIIDSDDSENISHLECSIFAQVLEFSSITSK